MATHVVADGDALIEAEFDIGFEKQDLSAGGGPDQVLVHPPNALGGFKSINNQFHGTAVF